jgi:hypothetical protein
VAPAAVVAIPATVTLALPVTVVRSHAHPKLARRLTAIEERLNAMDGKLEALPRIEESVRRLDAKSDQFLAALGPLAKWAAEQQRDKEVLVNGCGGATYRARRVNGVTQLYVQGQWCAACFPFGGQVGSRAVGVLTDPRRPDVWTVVAREEELVSAFK